MNFLDQFGSPAIFIFALLVVAVSFVLLRTSRYYSRQRRDKPVWSRATRPKNGKPARHLDCSPETTQWEVEMHETARALKAQLDSKMSALQALIAEADRAANRLEAALKSGDNMSPSNRMRPGGSPLFNPQPASQPKEENKRTGLPYNQAETLRPPAAATGVLSPHRQEEIYTLADHGLNDSAIARRLGMPVGEVELILSLRSKS